MILSAAYVEVFGTNFESPDWVPYIPWYLPRAAPNPDTVYAFAPIDSNGVYRIAGRKGTETIAAITLRKGGAHLGQRSAARVGEIDLTSVTADASGHFSFLLSRKRPSGLHGCLVRTAFRGHLPDVTACHQGCHRGRWSLWHRAARQAPGIDAALSESRSPGRIANVARYTSSQNEFLLGYMARLRQLGAERGLRAGRSIRVRGLIQQSHYFHRSSMDPDKPDARGRPVAAAESWRTQVINPFASTIDYVLHQSGLNDRQARVDSDGRVRAVLSLEDPGVPNWLDPAGWRQGGVQWRWNEVDVAPHPTVTKVKLDEVKRLLPTDTPSVSAPERRHALAARAAHYQSRRR